MYRAVRKVLNCLDILITREAVRLPWQKSSNVRCFHGVWTRYRANYFDALKKSMSEYGQDLFVLSELGFKRNGFFVEFGAGEGNSISNSWLLEKEFGWRGILAEPARFWHKDLQKNRPDAHIETKCVWRESGKVIPFYEDQRAYLSAIDSIPVSDAAKKFRTHGKRYDVETISLVDLLEKYHAPRVIDYLSIDTEGSEYEILRAFDFSKFRFHIITCEHNDTPNREKIYQLLTSKGYVQVMEGKTSVEDWYLYPGADDDAQSS